MKKILFVLLLCTQKIYAGFSSSNLLSKDTTLDYRHQFVDFQALGNGLGWLEISPQTQKPITLKVAPLHLQIIQPIWSIDKDKNTRISSFGILNRSNFLVNFESLYHDLNFSSISTISPNSISAGIFQFENSSLHLRGKLDFYSVANSGLGGESYGLVGGRFILENAEILLSSIRSDFADAYGLKGEFEVKAGSAILIKEILGREDAYGIYGKKSGEGMINIQTLSSKYGNAYGMIGNVSDGEIRIGKISSGQKISYGIYNFFPSVIEASLGFDAIWGKEGSYGIYNSSFLQLKNSSLSFDPSLKHAILSYGRLEILSSTLSFSPSIHDSSISLSNNHIILSDTLIKSENQKGIYGNGMITLLRGSKLQIDTPYEAFGGNLSVILGENASIESLRSGGYIQKLNAQSGAKISIKGHHTLHIQDFASHSATFSLKATPEANALLEIHSTSMREKMDNQLYVDLDSIHLSPYPTTLIKLPKNLGDSIVFNSIQNNGESAKTISYVGFDEVEILITREEKDDFVYYNSDLLALNYHINSAFFLPTNIALNANHTLFLLQPSLSRFQDLRDGNKQHGIWGKTLTGSGQEDFHGLANILYFSAQGGYDFLFCSSSSCNLIGVYANYIRGVSNQKTPSFGSFQAQEIISNGAEIGIYHSYTTESGVFWDSVFRGGILLSQIDLSYDPYPHTLKNYFLSFSQEVGYRWERDKWHIEPQALLSLSYLSPQSLTQTLLSSSTLYTLTSKQKALWDFRGKLGGKVGYFFGDMDEGVEISAGGFYVFDVFSGGEIELRSQNAMQILSPYSHNHQALLSISLQVFLANKPHLHFEFQRSFGGNLVQEYTLSFGMRFSFGHSPTLAQPNSDPKPLHTQAELLEYKSHS